MLTSLFGDLRSPREAKAKSTDFEDTQVVGGSQDFAATSIMESIATEVNERGQIVDRHVTTGRPGSPAQAIREHFAETRADLDSATSLITLVDPAGVWAAAVIKALRDAGGRPIERLQLRAPPTLRTLAMIERTTLVRRHQDTLRDVQRRCARARPRERGDPGRTDGTQPAGDRDHRPDVAARDRRLARLVRAAARLPTWRCPNLLFLLPPAAVWIAQRSTQPRGRGGSTSTGERAAHRRVVGLEYHPRACGTRPGAARLGCGGGRRRRTQWRPFPIRVASPRRAAPSSAPPPDSTSGTPTRARHSAISRACRAIPRAALRSPARSRSRDCSPAPLADAVSGSS